MTNLEVVYLHDNQLSGQLPAELANLTKVWYLRANNNSFTGTVTLNWPSPTPSINESSGATLYDGLTATLDAGTAWAAGVGRP